VRAPPPHRARGGRRRGALLSVAALLVLSGVGACEPKTLPQAGAGPDAGEAAPAPTARDDAQAPAAAAPVIPVDLDGVLRAAPAAERLAGNILTAGHAMETLAELTFAHPSRVTGTKGHEDAAAWAVDAFKKAGIASARVEPFTMAHGWERRPARAKLVAPAERTLHVAPAGWFPPTPDEGVRAEIVRPAELTRDAVKKNAARLKGKIVLLDPGNKTKGWPMALEALKDAGVLALVSAQGLPDQGLYAHSAWFARELVGPLPMVDLGSEDGKLLARLLEKGPVTVEVVSTSPVTGAVQVPNVVAEIRGRERPDEWVLVGAHLDAWDLAEGAQDDGTGVAEVLEAARAIAALGVPPRRSIRFALFGGEEQGALGSRAYADVHARELDRATLVLVTDSGAGAPKGFLTGRDDLVTRLAPIAKLLEGLGGGALSPTFDCGTDACPFALLGVPAIAYDCDESGYDDIHHRAADTFDKVVPAHVAQAAAIVAVTAWTAAEVPERIAPRAARAEIADRLKKAGIFDDLLYRGLFSP
jgi:carboxypeptidase Q